MNDGVSDTAKSAEDVLEIKREDGSILRRLVPVLVVLGVTLVLYSTLGALRLIWIELKDAGYEHGPLLGAVALVLLFRETPPHVRLPSAPWLLSFVLVICSVAWAFATAASTLSVSLALWPLISWLVLAAVYGPTQSSRYILPLALLYFALPVWGPMTNLVLWPLTVFVASNIVELLGINAYIDGNMVVIPSGSFEIISGCSGQQFFLVSCVVALLIGHLNLLRFKPFAVIFITAISVALLSNWLRVTAIIVIGYVTEMRHPLVGEGHLAFGWGMFAVAILAYCLWARTFLRSRPNSAFLDAPAAGAKSRLLHDESGPAWALLASILAVLVGPLWLAGATYSNTRADLRRALALPVDVPELVGPFASPSPLAPVFQRPDMEKAVAYSRANTEQREKVFVYVNLYFRQSQGAELVGHDTNWFPAERWRRVVPTFDSDENGDSLTSAYATVRATSVDGRDWLVRYAYAFERRTVGSAIMAKLLAGSRLLTLQSTKAGAIMVAVECDSDCATAYSLLSIAWSELSPALVANYGG